MKIQSALTALFACAALLSGGCDESKAEDPDAAAPKKASKVGRVEKTDAEWRKILTPEQYEVLRGKGTERACSGAFWDHHGEGTYVCAGCGLELFTSKAKFDSGTGWPSFFQPASKDHVAEKPDYSYGMIRTEVNCARCDGHLGHVFEDGPRPTGLRFCINSLALKFIPELSAEAAEKK